MIGFALLIAVAVLGFVVFAARARGGWIRHSLVGLALVLASGPLGVVVTFALLPLWSWLEESYGIESVGHSGPAEWCYLVCVLACLLALAFLYVMSVARERAEARR